MRGMGSKGGGVWNFGSPVGRCDVFDGLLPKNSVPWGGRGEDRPPPEFDFHGGCGEDLRRDRPDFKVEWGNFTLRIFGFFGGCV